jgi:hypothetical protein
METQIFYHANILYIPNLQKNLQKTKNPSRHYHCILAKSQVSTQAKISSFKNPHIKVDLLLPRGQNPLSYYIL